MRSDDAPILKLYKLASVTECREAPASPITPINAPRTPRHSTRPDTALLSMHNPASPPATKRLIADDQLLAMARINYKATPSLLLVSVLVAVLLARATSPLEGSLWWLFNMLTVVARGVVGRWMLRPGVLEKHFRAAEVLTLILAFLVAATWSVMAGITWLSSRGEAQRVAAILCIVAPMMGTMLRYRHHALLCFTAMTAYMPAFVLFAYGSLDIPDGAASGGGLLLFASYAFLMAWQLIRDQETLRQARIRAEDANRAKSAFLAMMSHEIRTPLTGVLGAAEALAPRLKDPTEAELISSISTSGEQLLAILNDVLDFSKIEAGGLKLSERVVQIDALIKASVEPYRPRAQAKGLELAWRLEPSMAREAYLDDTRLRQVLMNLVSNAVKFTERGTVTVQAGVQHREGDACLVFTVSDTGPGMDQPTLARLFLPFVQADARINRKHGGTGLGLAISRRLVELMHGSLQVSSRPGVGSHFEVVIPHRVLPSTGPLVSDAPDQISASAAAGSVGTTPQLIPLPSLPAGHALGLQHGLASDPNAQASDRLTAPPIHPSSTHPTVRPVALPADAPDPANRPLHGCKLLVAEDNNINRRIIVKMVETLGASVVAVENGQLALDELAAHPFDVVLMDMQMPELDGLSATRALRATPGGNQHVPVIAFTANAFAEDRQACAQAGMDDFLAKPVRQDDLRATIERALARANHLT